MGHTEYAPDEVYKLIHGEYPDHSVNEPDVNDVETDVAADEEPEKSE